MILSAKTLSSMARLSGGARLAAVIGDPIQHSLSPRLHNFWLESENIDGLYLPLHVRAPRLEEALRALAALGFRGANVTIPHKQRAALFCTSLSERAQRTQTVNTIVFDDHRIHGDSTDGEGFLRAIDAESPNVALDHVVLLGAGGAARAVLDALCAQGKADRVSVWNRTQEKAIELAQLYPKAEPIEHEALARALGAATCLINATGSGLSGHPPIDLDLLPTLASTVLALDLVYGDTDFLLAARQRGARVQDGLAMLVAQAQPGFQHWFGVTPNYQNGLNFLRQSLS